MVKRKYESAVHLLPTYSCAPQEYHHGSENPTTGLTRPLIVFASIWEFIQVGILLLFSPPFEPILTSISLKPPSLQLFTYQSLFFHALAMPFIAVLVYVSLEVLGVDSMPAKYAVYNVTASYPIVSAGSFAMVLARWSPIAHGLLFSGLVLGFSAGVAMLIALHPFRRIEGGGAERRRIRVIRLNVWLAIFFVLATTLVGGYATLGSSQWGATGSIERFVLVVAAHRHAIITVIDAAIVSLAAAHFGLHRFNGIRGLFGDIGLYATIIGIPIVSVSTYATIPLGVAAHNAITPSGALLLQAALFIMYAIMADLVVKGGRGNVLVKLFRDPVSFSLLFIFFWVNVAVTLPGIYVAVNLQQFVGLPNEKPFILGHEHALITITAAALLLFATLLFNIGRVARYLIGSVTTVGYTVGLGAAVPYVFLDPNPAGSFALPYIQLGIILMMIGWAASIVAMIQALTSPRGFDR